MKANIKDKPLRTYSRIPKSWDQQPNIMNYDKATDLHDKDGWRDVIIPTFNSDTQRLGELIIDGDTITKRVIDKTPEELEAERKALVPFSIAKLQAMIMLSRIGIKDQVIALVEASDNQEVQLYFEHAATWERASPIINSFAPALGMTQEDLDNFFIEAEKIS